MSDQKSKRKSKSKSKHQRELDDEFKVKSNAKLPSKKSIRKEFERTLRKETKKRPSGSKSKNNTNDNDNDNDDYGYGHDPETNAANINANRNLLLLRQIIREEVQNSITNAMDHKNRNDRGRNGSFNNNNNNVRPRKKKKKRLTKKDIEQNQAKFVRSTEIENSSQKYAIRAPEYDDDVNVVVGSCRMRYGKLKYTDLGDDFVVVDLSLKGEYKSLNLFELETKKHQKLMNKHEFSKVHVKLGASNTSYSNEDNVKTILWSWSEENHVKVGSIDDETDKPESIKLNSKLFKAWSSAGLDSELAIRNPVPNKISRMDYVCHAIEKKSKDKKKTKMIYYSPAAWRINKMIPLYNKYVKKCEQFDELKEMLENGKKLLIVDNDGPAQSKLDYYCNIYNVPLDFIQRGTVAASSKNLQVFLRDNLEEFGVGFMLAAALQDIDLVEDLKNHVENQSDCEWSDIADTKKLKDLYIDEYMHRHQQIKTKKFFESQ